MQVNCHSHGLLCIENKHYKDGAQISLRKQGREKGVLHFFNKLIRKGGPS
jgi:hypothetical protein